MASTERFTSLGSFFPASLCLQAKRMKTRKASAMGRERKRRKEATGLIPCSWTSRKRRLDISRPGCRRPLVAGVLCGTKTQCLLRE
ncbi:hypothetical protein ANANG_G00251570, partial [Anguilla anguilla]